MVGEVAQLRLVAAPLGDVLHLAEEVQRRAVARCARACSRAPPRPARRSRAGSASRSGRSRSPRRASRPSPRASAARSSGCVSARDVAALELRARRSRAAAPSARLTRWKCPSVAVIAMPIGASSNVERKRASASSIAVLAAIRSVMSRTRRVRLDARGRPRRAARACGSRPTPSAPSARRSRSVTVSASAPAATSAQRGRDVRQVVGMHQLAAAGARVSVARARRPAARGRRARGTRCGRRASCTTSRSVDVSASRRERSSAASRPASASRSRRVPSRLASPSTSVSSSAMSAIATVRPGRRPRALDRAASTCGRRPTSTAHRRVPAPSVAADPERARRAARARIRARRALDGRRARLDRQDRRRPSRAADGRDEQRAGADRGGQLERAACARLVDALGLRERGPDPRAPG